MITVVEGFPVPAAQKRLPYRVVITATLQPEVDLAFSRRFCDVVLITGQSLLQQLTAPSPLVDIRLVAGLPLEARLGCLLPGHQRDLGQGSVPHSNGRHSP